MKTYLMILPYVKDVGNRLDQFVGIWVGTYENKTYHITFVKKVAYNISGDPDGIKWDFILGIISIMQGRGTIYSNHPLQRVGQPEVKEPTNFFGIYFLKNSNTYVMSFGGRCYNEFGDVFITILNGQPDKMRLSFAMGKDLQTNDCPDGLHPLFPISPQNMTLTKQN